MNICILIFDIGFDKKFGIIDCNFNGMFLDKI